MAGIARTAFDWAIKGDANYDDYCEALAAPENKTELYVLGLGLIGTSVIGTVWVVSKVIKGGAAIRRFLKR